MDRNYFYQNRAQEHQRELSQELATRHLLKDSGLTAPLSTQQVRLLAVRIAPVIIVITVLLLLGSLG